MPVKNLRALRKKLDKFFSLYIRLRDLEKGCISCGKRKLMGKAWHAGHYFPRSEKYLNLYFDEKNVNGQCAYCNIFLEGNKEHYRRGLLSRYGPGVIDELLVKNSLPKSKWGTFEYGILIKSYEERIKNFSRNDNPRSRSAKSRTR